jgi:hypothetical protein
MTAADQVETPGAGAASAPPGPGRRGRLLALAPAALVVVATFLAHGDGIANGFVWDDPAIVVENPNTRDLSQLGHVLLSPDELPPYYRPLNRASYLLDYQLFGMDPRGFHLVNVLLQAASAVALLGLGRRLFAATGPALLAALLLAVHPIHVEAVAFVTARNNLFALLFAILSLSFLADAAARRSRGRAVLSACALLLALLSKEQGAMVLPVLVAWLYLPGLPGRSAGASRWRLLVPHAAAVAVYAVLRAVSLGAPGASTAILPGLWGRLAVNAWTVPGYLSLALFPRGLTIFHEAPGPLGAWAPAAWALALAGVVALVRRPTVASTVGLLWLALNHLPAANVIPIPSNTVMAERYFHASAAGLWLVLADVGWRASARVPRAWTAAVAAAIVAALGARTIVRNRDWRDDLALYQSAVRVEPGSAVAHFNLGVALKDVGDLAGAQAEWGLALAIKPDDPGSHAQLGTLAAVRGDLRAAEAHYRVALQGDPALPEAQLNLATICERTGRAAEALTRYRAVLEARPPPEPELVGRARAGLERLARGAGPTR